MLRIVNTALNKINFGVQIDHRKTDRFAAGNMLCNSGTPEQAQALASIEVNLGSVFFDTNSAQVREDQEGIVADIISKLKEYGGGTIMVEAHTDSRGDYQYNLALAERRATTLRDRLRDALGGALMQSVSVEVDPQGLVEAKQ